MAVGSYGQPSRLQSTGEVQLEGVNGKPATATGNIGNKWYYLIYPLANIDALWETDVDFLKAQWTVTHGSKAASEALWRQVYGYLAKEEKSVYQVLPDLTVVDGEIGLPAKGQGKFHYDNYLRIVDIRVHKDRTTDFENFVHTNVVPAVAKFLPKVEGQAGNKLPRYLRSVKIATRLGAEPDLLDFLTNYVVPAAKSTGTDVFIYRGVYSSGANYFMLFPFDDPSSLANSTDSVFTELLAKAYPGKEHKKLGQQFANTVSLVQEIVSKTRPDMSSNLENKYTRWWQ
jgi:hypothetical protein